MKRQHFVHLKDQVRDLFKYFNYIICSDCPSSEIAQLQIIVKVTILTLSRQKRVKSDFF